MADLTYSLTDKQLGVIETTLKENGFDASQTTGTIIRSGVTIQYSVTPENGLNRLELTIEHHMLLEPKPMIILRIQKMMAEIPQA